MQNFTKDDADAKKNLKDHERIKGWRLNHVGENTRGQNVFMKTMWRKTRGQKRFYKSHVEGNTHGPKRFV